jgi:hypothetical protein
LQINKKCKANTTFRKTFDYIYGIITIVTDWYLFQMKYAVQVKILLTSDLLNLL